MKALKLIPRRAAIVWVVLILLTIVNPVLGNEGASGGHIFAVVILTIAMVKVRLVGLDFMELRKSPRAMRITFEVYCLILWVVLTTCYLWL